MTAPTDSSAVATSRRADGYVRAAALLWAAFAGFTLIVGLGLIDGTDQRLARLARPDAVWFPRQQNWSYVTYWLSPLHVAAALAIVTVIAALARRSVRPLLLTGLTCGLASVLTVGLKIVLARPDVQGNLVGHGSYPSGHAVMTVTAAGLTLMLISGRPAWWHLVVPLLPGAVLGTGLVIVGMHWAGDALGGALLAESLLATAAAVLTRTAGVDRVSSPRRSRASA